MATMSKSNANKQTTKIPVTREEKSEVPLPTTTNNDSKKKILFWFRRMLLAFVAVGFSWATSLRNARHLASSVIAVPNMTDVYKTIVETYNVANDEKLKYSMCVESQLYQCNGRLDKSVEREDQRVRVILKNNYELVLRAEDIALECHKAYTTMRLALEEWTGNGGNIPIHPDSVSVCSPADREKVNETLLGTQNAVVMKVEAMGMNSEFESASTMTVENLYDYFQKRREYDEAYMANYTNNIKESMLRNLNGMKTPTANFTDIYKEYKLAQKDLLACLSLDENDKKRDGRKCKDSMAEMTRTLYDNVTGQMDYLEKKLIDSNDVMEGYKADAKEAEENWMKFYNGVNTAAAKWAIKTFTGADWWGTESKDVSISDVEFPDIDTVLNKVGNFPEIPWDIRDAPNAEFDANLEKVMKKIDRRAQKQLTDMKKAASFLAILGIYTMTPVDYNPPKYEGTSMSIASPEEEVASYKQRSIDYLNDSKEAVQSIPGSGTKFAEDALNMHNIPFNLTDVRVKVTDIGNTNYETLQTPDIDVDFWFFKIADFSDMLVYLDYVVRGIFSLRTVYRYWFVTSLAMPSIDLRVNRNTFFESPLKMIKMNPFKAMLAFATSTVGMFTFLAVVGTWAIGGIATVYIPLFNQYSHGCVSIHGNGTFLSHNIYPIAYNHAYQDGRNMFEAGSDVFDRKRNDACSSKYSKSANLQNEISSNFTRYANFHGDVLDQMGVAQRCIDSTELESAFTESCCGIADYPECTTSMTTSNVECPMDDRKTKMNVPFPFDLPGDWLEEPTCSATLSGSEWKINDATFNCDDLSTCTMTCPGPDVERLKKASETSGCTVGWFIHSKVLLFSLACLFYILMNIARVLFFKGVTRIFWRYLYPNRFTLWMTCDSDGTLVSSDPSIGLVPTFGDLVDYFQGTRSRNLSEQLCERIDASLRKFRQKGFGYLLGSIVFNTFWIFLMLKVRHNVVPRVWQ